MVRPKHTRTIEEMPLYKGFRPMGIRTWDVETVTLGLDEMEAIRLADIEGLYQDEAASRMEVSRATYGRILAAGRSKVASAIIEGKFLLFGEAPVTVSGRPGRGCPVHEGEWRRGRHCRCPRKKLVQQDNQKEKEQ